MPFIRLVKATATQRQETEIFVARPAKGHPLIWRIDDVCAFTWPHLSSAGCRPALIGDFYAPLKKYAGLTLLLHATVLQEA